jgi:hypothetical protein
VNSIIGAKFRKLFDGLPEDIQMLARQAYRLWIDDPWHNSLQYKQVHASKPYYSVRVGSHWRAVGLKSGTEMMWFWIGSHADYDNLLKQL